MDARTVRIDGLPRRRLAMVTAREVQMSLADQAVRESVRYLVEKHMQTRGKAKNQVRSRPKRG
jgi:hypothetical protein